MVGIWRTNRLSSLSEQTSKRPASSRLVAIRIHRVDIGMLAEDIFKRRPALRRISPSQKVATSRNRAIRCRNPRNFQPSLSMTSPWTLQSRMAQSYVQRPKLMKNARSIDERSWPSWYELEFSHKSIPLWLLTIQSHLGPSCYL